MAPQLGLTRDFLINVEKEVLSSRAEIVAELMQELEVKREAADQGMAVAFSEVAMLKVRLDEVMKLGNPHEGEKNEVQHIRNCLFAMETLAVAMQDNPDVHGLSLTEVITVIEAGLDAAFELCLIANAQMVENYMSYAEKLTNRLVEKMEAGLVQDVAGVLYYDFKRRQFEALAAVNIMNDAAADTAGNSLDKSLIDKAYNKLDKAVQTWRKMRENSLLRASSGSTMVSEGSQMLENLGILQCELGKLKDGMLNIKEAQGLIWTHWSKTTGTIGSAGQDLLDVMPQDVRTGLVGSYYNLAICTESRADQEHDLTRALSEEALDHVSTAQRILSSVYPGVGTGSIGGLERVVRGEGDVRALEGEELEQVSTMWSVISQRVDHLKRKLAQLTTDSEKRKVVRKKRKNRTSIGS